MSNNILAAHASGPWTVTEHSWSRTGIYAESEVVAALDIYDDATEDNQEELEARMAANARLIAAAPDLLAALQGVLRVADRATDEFDAARAAIARAEGATQ